MTYRHGTYALQSGIESGTVSGLNIDSEDVHVKVRRIFPRVRKPAGGLNLFASIVTGTLNGNGFQFDLSGQTDSADYKLDYLIIL